MFLPLYGFRFIVGNALVDPDRLFQLFCTQKILYTSRLRECVHHSLHSVRSINIMFQKLALFVTFICFAWGPSHMRCVVATVEINLLNQWVFNSLRMWRNMQKKLFSHTRGKPHTQECGEMSICIAATFWTDWCNRTQCFENREHRHGCWSGLSWSI